MAQDKTNLSQVTGRHHTDVRRWDFTCVGNTWLGGGIRMNTVARVTMQCNTEREAVADAFDGIFLGELFLFSIVFCM